MSDLFRSNLVLILYMVHVHNLYSYQKPGFTSAKPSYNFGIVSTDGH